MKKEKDKHKHTATRSRVVRVETERDWQPLFARLQSAFEWALDIASHLAREIEEDVEAVERTRGYMRAWIEGRPVKVNMDDVLTTLAVLFAAIEIDLGIDSSPMLQALAACDRVLHLPGAAHDDRPTVVIRTPVRRRNAAPSVFTQLAA